MLQPEYRLRLQWPGTDAMGDASRKRVGRWCYGPLHSCRQQLSVTGIEELMVGILFCGHAAYGDCIYHASMALGVKHWNRPDHGSSLFCWWSPICRTASCLFLFCPIQAPGQ